MEHKDNECVEEKYEVTDDEGREDGDSNSDDGDDDKYDQDWWAPCTSCDCDLISVLSNLFCFKTL